MSRLSRKLVLIVVTLALILSSSPIENLYAQNTNKSDFVTGEIVAMAHADSNVSGITTKTWQNAEDILNNRLKKIENLQYQIYRDEQGKTFVVNMYTRDINIANNSKTILRELFSVNFVSLQEVDEKLTDQNGYYKPTCKIDFAQSDFEKATVENYKSTGEKYISVKLNSIGTKKLKDFKSRLKTNNLKLGLFIDDKPINVNIYIPEGLDTYIYLKGNIDNELEQQLLNVLNNKPLPLKYEVKSLLIKKISSWNSLKLKVISDYKIVHAVVKIKDRVKTKENQLQRSTIAIMENMRKSCTQKNAQVQLITDAGKGVSIIEIYTSDKNFISKYKEIVQKTVKTESSKLALELNEVNILEVCQ